MDAAQLAHFKAKLEQAKRDIVAQADERIDPNRADGTTRTDEDAQPLNEMNQVIASRRNRLRSGSLKQVQAALNKLRNTPEDFGLCEECEEPIPQKRLELMPFAEYCVGCQSGRDEQRGQRRRNLTDYSG